MELKALEAANMRKEMTPSPCSLPPRLHLRLCSTFTLCRRSSVLPLPPPPPRSLPPRLRLRSTFTLRRQSNARFDKCVRLSHIFRQAGNEEASYRDTLQRFSNGTSTIEDWHLFRTRDYSILSTKEKANFKNALRLFSTKDAASAYNHNRLVELGKLISRIPSKNNCDTSYKASSDEAKGLEKILCLTVGARVMLQANLATHNGLVNGAMDTVKDIVYGPGCKSPYDLPLTVMVDFDNYHGVEFIEKTNIIPIAPQTCNWKTSSGISCQRTQLPIALCWAITIHKNQGLTLERAVVDIGERECLGLTFVTLSRTRKLCDLAFNPMFSFERLQNIGKCKGLKGRLEEEERLLLLQSMLH